MPEEALVPRLMIYTKNSGTITPEIVMHLALDFGVSYTAMLNRMVSRGVEIIDESSYRQFSKDKVTTLLGNITRSICIEGLSRFPREYTEMAYDAYSLGHISLSKLASMLQSTIEQAQSQLKLRNVPINLGVNSESER